MKTKKCPFCAGLGKDLDTLDYPCPHCKGTGVLFITEDKTDERVDKIKK